MTKNEIAIEIIIFSFAFPSQMIPCFFVTVLYVTYILL